MTYVVWDVETTIKTHNKRKASPFCPDNHVVASGWKRRGLAAPIGEYFGRARPKGDWFRKLLEHTTVLVGFNIKFDLLHALSDPDNYRAWQQYVTNGGRVWDCQLAEYLLHGMAREHHMLSLDEVAPRYGGHLKNDAVKALWEAGVDTTEIDKDLLMEYLIGNPNDPKDLGDIGNTEKILLGQVKAFRARGGMQSALLNMDALLCTVEMERNGMFVDKERGLALAADLEVQLDKLRAELNGSLPSNLPFQFNWSSRHQLSALVFGGKIKYTAKVPLVDDKGGPVYYQKEELHYVLDDGTTTVITPNEAAESGQHSKLLMQYVTYSGGKNAGEYKTKKVKVPDIARGSKTKNEDFLYSFPGFTTPSPEWESSTPGVYSVASDIIEALGNRDIPFLNALAGMASLAKDLGTYYITTDPDTGESKGMLTLVDSDGCVHHQLNMCNTVTARLSSSNPNLQNISGKGKSEVKSVFVSRFGEHRLVAGKKEFVRTGKIIQSDFTSLEIYMQAILTQCRQLIEDLRANLDMHCLRVSQKRGMKYEEVLRLVKEVQDPKWIKERKDAKEMSFQRAYGAGVKKIAAYTGMSEEDVEALIAVEATRYPEVDQFYEMLTDAIKSRRVPTNRFVQHPEIPGMTCQLGRSHYTTPDGKMYSYSESPSPGWLARRSAAAGGSPQSFSPTEIRNYVVQGTGGEWTKAAMALAIRAFMAHENFGARALLVNQVHDANYVDSAAEVEMQSAALLHACMEEASAYMEYLFEWKIPVPVPTETKTGSSMIEEVDLPDSFKLQVRSYRNWIRDNYMKGFVPSFEGEKQDGIQPA